MAARAHGMGLEAGDGKQPNLHLVTDAQLILDVAIGLRDCHRRRTRTLGSNRENIFSYFAS